VDEGELLEALLEEPVERRPLRVPGPVDPGGFPNDRNQPGEWEKQRDHGKKQVARRWEAGSRKDLGCSESYSIVNADDGGLIRDLARGAVAR